jgi:hypothetical protein
MVSSGKRIIVNLHFQLFERVTGNGHGDLFQNRKRKAMGRSFSGACRQGWRRHFSRQITRQIETNTASSSRDESTGRKDEEKEFS